VPLALTSGLASAIARNALGAVADEKAAPTSAMTVGRMGRLARLTVAVSNQFAPIATLAGRRSSRPPTSRPLCSDVSARLYCHECPKAVAEEPMRLGRIENGDHVVTLSFDAVIAALLATEAATATMNNMHGERSAKGLGQLLVGVGMEDRSRQDNEPRSKADCLVGDSGPIRGRCVFGFTYAVAFLEGLWFVESSGQVGLRRWRTRRP